MTIGTNSTLGINDFKYRVIKYLYLKFYNLRLEYQQLSLLHGRKVNYIVIVYKEVDRTRQMKHRPALNRSLAKAGAMIDSLVRSEKKLDEVLHFKQVVVYLCIKALGLPGRLPGTLLRYCYSISHRVFRQGGVLTTGSTFPQMGTLQQSLGPE
jgi:hypothetical protein